MEEETKTKKSKKEDVLPVSDEETRIYELSFLLLPMIAEDSLPEEIQKLRLIVENHKGQIISEETPKLIELAYEMSKKVEAKKKKFQNAFFGWMKFQAVASEVKKMEKELRDTDNVLRFLLVKPPKEESPAKRAKRQDREAKRKVKLPEDLDEEKIDKTIDELVV